MKFLALTLLGLTLAPAAQAATITFEDLGDGAVVTNQYPGVVFSSSSGQVNQVTAQGGIGFGTNFICTAEIGGGLTCSGETILTFANLVKNLTFWQVGDNATGVVAQVQVFVSGLFSATVDILGFNDFNTPDLVDLTAFDNVSAIRIFNITDPGGLGWDDFSFETADAGPAPVPLPATLGLLGAALGGIGMLRRKAGRV